MPPYLAQTYWWAYLHPNAVRVFERQWLVNLILWCNFARLRDAALAELGATVRGNVLQVACVYGDFTPQLTRRLAPGAHPVSYTHLDVYKRQPACRFRGLRIASPRQNGFLMRAA